MLHRQVQIGDTYVDIAEIGTAIANSVTAARILLSKEQECYFSLPDAAYSRAVIDDMLMKGLINGTIKSIHHDPSEVHSNLTCVLIEGVVSVCIELVELNKTYLRELGYLY